MARPPLFLLLLGAALLGPASLAHAGHGQTMRGKPLALNQRSSKSAAGEARRRSQRGRTSNQRKPPSSVSSGVFQGRIRHGSATVEANYIVEVCDGADQEALLDHIAAQHADESQPEWHGRVKHVYRSVLQGMALEGVSASALEELLRLASVCGVAEVGVARKSGTKSWGINRIDQPALPLDGSYTPTDPEGLNVSVFVLDTGLDTTHDEFSGSGRTVANVWDAYDSTLEANNDVDGHGSHCAGTVGGATVGVAPLANLYGVKVLDDDGSGSYSDIIAGLDYVVSNATSPAVISMSLGGGYYSVLNDAIDAAVDAGITVVVAAGNSYDDACLYSPASAYSAVTVGSTTRHDHVSWFSNYGECVDIYAPGSDITSVDTGTTDSYANLSGTSMACPHVAGVAALVLSGVDSNFSPGEVAQYLDCTAETGLLDTVEYSYWSDDSERSLLQVPDLNATCNITNSSTAYFDIVGDCTRSGACFYSPNYPSDYDSSSICFIYPTVEATLSVTSFDLEDDSSCGYDYLSVDGTLYCGTSGPDGVSVDADSTLIFYSDTSVTGGGFEICLAGSPTPAPTSPFPTPSPTISAAPTITFQPTPAPTPAPTPVPTVSLPPTSTPTMAPSACGKACSATDQPTSSPTSSFPTPSPTISPAPTITFEPTSVPTPVPTPVPTLTFRPTSTPTMAPSACGKACSDDDFLTNDDDFWTNDDDGEDDESGSSSGMLVFILMIHAVVLIVIASIAACWRSGCCEGCDNEPQPSNRVVAVAPAPAGVDVVQPRIYVATATPQQPIIQVQVAQTPQPQPAEVEMVSTTAGPPRKSEFSSTTAAAESG